MRFSHGPATLVLALAACHHEPPPAAPGVPVPVTVPSPQAVDSGTSVDATAPSPQGLIVVNTPRRPVVDHYQGVAVTDDYQWLEDVRSPEVRAWIDAQNHRTRAALDGIPFRAAIEQRLTEIFNADVASYGSLRFRGHRLFALRTRPGAQQPFLVALPSADDPSGERVVVDPNVIDPTGRTAIDLYTPSHDARRVAVALAVNGSEVGTLHTYDVATGHEVGEAIAHVSNPTGGGSVEWTADNTGLLYTRYPRHGERPPADEEFYQQVYYHRLGTPVTADRYEIGREFPRIAETALDASPDGRWILATVANGDGGEFSHYLRSSAGTWTRITHDTDGISRAAFGPDGALYLLNRHSPFGTILRLPLSTPRLASAVPILGAPDPVLARAASSRPRSDHPIPVPAVPEGVIEGFVPTATRLYVTYLVGGPSVVRVFDHHGHLQGQVGLPPVSSVTGMIPTTGDEVLFRSETYLTPPIWYRAMPGHADAVATALRDQATVTYTDCEVSQESVLSLDGTRVPVVVIRRHGTRMDHQNPVLLTGYGGYGVSLVPSYSLTNRLWLDRGGVIAVAILRGGGEFGEAWHHAGNLTRKQNVFDDFIAAAHHMIDAGYTTPARLAIRGRSNGGLLMGAALTQHPELFRAVYSGVGIYDMLRVERDPNGAFNVTEFGSVENPEQFRALYAYSPYHHVTDGVHYPAVLLTTGEHDGRVNPTHSFKMAARLQAATGSDRPILLRVSAHAGHGMGSGRAEVIAEQTDVWTFLFDQLGMTADVPVPTP